MLCWLLFAGCTQQPTTPQPPTTTPVTADTAVYAGKEWYCAAFQKSNKPATQAVSQKGAYWPIGTVLKVGFIGGTTAQRSYPIQAFKLWSAVANIAFTFPPSGPYDLRIAFKPSDGAWSYIGTDAKTIAQKSPTINLGWDGLDVSLHEIGHSIGFVHEQSSPVSGICWNKDQVYKDLGGPPNNWSKAMVDANVFFQYQPSDVDFTAYDPVSIMEYQIPGKWTCSGVGIPGGQVLSEKDKFLAAQLYPGVITVTPPPPPNPTDKTLTAAQVTQIYTSAQKTAAAAQNTLNAAQAAKTASDSTVAYIKRTLGL